MDWEIYNILLKDAKIIDLVTFFGDDPFPTPVSDKSYDERSETTRTISSEVVDETEALSVVGKEEVVMADGGRTGVGDAGSKVDPLSSSSIEAVKEREREDSDVLEAGLEENIVHLNLKPHEGEESRSPFSVHPKQLVSTSDLG